VNTIGPVVYILGSVTSFACGVLLWRAWRNARVPLPFWSALCFLGLAFSNFGLFLDLVIFPEKDLLILRLGTAALSFLFLVFGLVWERD
jgi:hypothetical protein